MVAKTINKKTNKTERIKITDGLAAIAGNRLVEVTAVMRGESRARSYRWHGNTSLYNTMRMKNLLADLRFGQSVTRNKINTLKAEISSFDSILGPQLSKALSTLKVNLS